MALNLTFNSATKIFKWTVKVLFHEKTEYQDIKIMQTGQFGNMLLLGMML